MTFHHAIAVSQDGRLKWISSLAEHVAARGATMDDFLGKYAWEEVVDAEVIQAAITRCVTTGEPQTFESVSADGRWRTQFHH